MKNNFNSRAKALRETANRFDAESNKQKTALLKELAVGALPLTKALTAYFETLLFIMAFPPDEKTFNAALREVNRITAFVKKQSEKTQELFVNSGIPFSKYRAAYSHDCTRWLLTHPDVSIHIYKIENVLFDLNETLKVTLPSTLRSETTAGLSDTDLLKEVMPDKKLQLPFLINELSRFDKLPYVKDHYYESLGIQTDIIPKNRLFSKAYNRIDTPEFYYHSDMVKHFDVAELLNRKIPNAAVLSEPEKKKVMQVIKNSMAVTERETDPATFMKEDSLRLFHLERGVSVAIYAMPHERQLPLESYFGYTLFKNGYPAAYAGGWVFGSRSDYGLNIYDQFRGGESAYMVAQVLRIYRQVFSVNYFQVEASQFGLDNPEGIATGVFWFYYKLGFRPVDSKLKKLALEEHRKIVSRNGYRSSEKILLKFTESNIGLNLGKNVQAGVYDITEKVKRMMIKKYRGNCALAEQTCVEAFLTKTNCTEVFSEAENEVLKEVSLWAAAMNITDSNKLNLLLQMVKLKPADEFLYQEKVRLFFAVPKS